MTEGNTVTITQPIRKRQTVLIGTATPTRCGIATYTTNLCSALRSVDTEADIVRVAGDVSDGSHANPLVIADWYRNHPAGAFAAAAVCNEYDSVLLQHEFGIYPGQDGAEVLTFLRELDRPVVSVLHTVLDEPTRRQRAILDELLDGSDAVVVHGQVARARLLATHGIEPEKVTVIPHGATARSPESDEGPMLPPFLLTWGLLGPGKGIEHVIEALAILRSNGIDVHYVIAGSTHPSVMAATGERYRNGLARTAEQLGVADLVHFDDRYRSARDQRDLVALASAVVLPYDSRDQVTSGVLVEAIAAGRPVIATAFPHAVELAATGAVSVVAHESAPQLASAIGRVVLDPDVAARMRAAAFAEGRNYDWPNVGRSFARLLDAVSESEVVLR